MQIADANPLSSLSSLSSLDVLNEDVLFKLLSHVDTRSLFRLRRVCRRLYNIFEYVLGVRIRNQSVEPFAVTLVDNYMVAKTFNEEVDRQQAVIQQNYRDALVSTGMSWVNDDPDDDEILFYMQSGDSDDDTTDEPVEKIKIDTMVTA